MNKGSLIYIVTALLLCLVYWGSMRALNIEMRSILFVIPIYLALIGLAFEGLLIKTQDAKKFVVTYMGLSGGKMFLSIFILFGYVFFNRDYIWPFGICFLVGYFTFTALEIMRLLRHFKK